MKRTTLPRRPTLAARLLVAAAALQLATQAGAQDAADHAGHATHATPHAHDAAPAEATHAHAAPAPATHVHDRTPDPHASHGEEAKKQLYTCGMHPQVIRDQPGTCPICGMELVPVGTTPASGGGAGVVTIDPAIVQNMGVRTATVTAGPLRRTVRANGVLAEAEPLQHDVNLRVSGWIERLHANVQGMQVRAGDPLFDLYSPELQVAIGELISARRARDAHGSQAILVGAATQKLELLGLPPAQIERLGRLEAPPATVTFTSPIDGVVIEKPIVTGDAVQVGMRALRIVDHRELWVDARIFEQDLPAVRVGQPARVTIASRPGAPIEGRISFVHPMLDPATRTTTARLTVPNASLSLRPGMYATVGIESELAPHALLAPREAVIDTGTESVVFLARDGGRFEPRRVTVGATGDDGRVEVLDGLAAGDVVVTSGQFLLDAESNMQEALERFRAAGAGHVH